MPSCRASTTTPTCSRWEHASPATRKHLRLLPSGWPLLLPEAGTAAGWTRSWPSSARKKPNHRPRERLHKEDAIMKTNPLELPLSESDPQIAQAIENEE